MEVFRRSQPTIYGAAYRTPPLRQGSPETHFLQVCHALIARYPTIFRRHSSEHFFPRKFFKTSRQPLLYALIVGYDLDSKRRVQHRLAWFYACINAGDEDHPDI